MWRPGKCCVLCLKLRRSAGIDFSTMPRPLNSSKVVTWMKGKIKGIMWSSFLLSKLLIYESEIVLCFQCYWTLQEVVDSRESCNQCRRAGISPETIPEQGSRGTKSDADRWRARRRTTQPRRGGNAQSREMSLLKKVILEELLQKALRAVESMRQLSPAIILSFPSNSHRSCSNSVKLYMLHPC